MTSGLASAPRVHAVFFYEDDRQVVDEVVDFVTEGLERQGRVFAVVTTEHRTAIVDALVGLGIDPHTSPVAGRLVFVDARTTLRSFMTRNGPDRDRFMADLGRRVLDAGSDGAPVRVFGEMVGLLWQAGDVESAIALEAMWNGLAHRLGFDLLCAYPSTLVGADNLTAVHGVCGQHSEVRPPTGYATSAGDRTSRTRVFLPVPEAVASSRRFVIATLRQLGADHLVHDAALVVSELATNAFRHAGSPFQITVDESAEVIRISVQDVGAGSTVPRVGRAEELAIDGRGMAIIEALSRRWGCDDLPDGKVVWAELAVAPAHSARGRNQRRTSPAVPITTHRAFSPADGQAP